MTKNTKQKPPEPPLLEAVTLRLGQDDIELLNQTADALKLPGDRERNLSRAARVLFGRVRKKEKA